MLNSPTATRENIIIPSTCGYSRSGTPVAGRSGTQGRTAGRLLGNPMTAVLYPGKVLYAVLPYAWAARLYVIAHTIIAFWGLLAFGAVVRRELGGIVSGRPELRVQGAGAAPLLQRDLPGRGGLDALGPCAIDRLLRRGLRTGGAELAVVLALQVLGGDPEAAYLTAVCGAGYALVLAVWARKRPIPSTAVWITLGAVGAWVMATLGLARTRIAWPGFTATNGLVLAAWMAAALAIGWRWRRRPVEARLAPRLAGLAGSGILAVALAAVQVLPVLEFAGRTGGCPGRA